LRANSLRGLEQSIGGSLRGAGYNYVINIDEYKHRNMVLVVDEQRCVILGSLKTILDQLRTQQRIPCSRCLFHPIQCLVEFENMIFVPEIFITRWLSHINFLFQNTM
jgi:hypothetical protein